MTETLPQLCCTGKDCALCSGAVPQFATVTLSGVSNPYLCCSPDGMPSTFRPELSDEYCHDSCAWFEDPTNNCAAAHVRLECVREGWVKITVQITLLSSGQHIIWSKEIPTPVDCSSPITIGPPPDQNANLCGMANASVTVSW